MLREQCIIPLNAAGHRESFIEFLYRRGRAFSLSLLLLHTRIQSNAG